MAHARSQVAISADSIEPSGSSLPARPDCLRRNGVPPAEVESPTSDGVATISDVRHDPLSTCRTIHWAAMWLYGLMKGTAHD